MDFAFYQWEGRPSIDGVGVQSMFTGSVAAVILDRPPLGFAVLVESLPKHIPIDIIQTLNISPGESIYLLYAHLKEPPMVVLRSRINCGQTLGFVGNTGFSGAPHLHLEVRVGPQNLIFESMAYYDTRASQEEMENYRLWRLEGIFRPINPQFVLDTFRP
jgi:murein DD-endopeptidase MepM/ murein hydrolase activator NlpD